MGETWVKRGTYLNLAFPNVKTAGNTGSVKWIAAYQFGPQKRPVVNKIKSELSLRKWKNYRA